MKHYQDTKIWNFILNSFFYIKYYLNKVLNNTYFI